MGIRSAAFWVVIFWMTAGIFAGLTPRAALAHEGDEEEGGEAAAPPDTMPSPYDFLDEGVRAPDFTLIDQDGKEIRLSQFKGDPVILIVTYVSCPDACPLILQSRRKLEDSVGMGKDTVFLAVTIDPANDTPDILKGYIKKTGLDEDRLHLLTGKPEVVEQTLKNYHINTTREPDTGKVVGHTLVGYAIDREGMVSQTIVFSF